MAQIKIQYLLEPESSLFSQLSTTCDPHHGILAKTSKALNEENVNIHSPWYSKSKIIRLSLDVVKYSATDRDWQRNIAGTKVSMLNNKD